MIIVGIDPGLAKFAVVAIEVQAVHVLTPATVLFKRTVRTGQKDTAELLATRLLARYNELQGVLDDAAAVKEIAAIAIEDPCDAWRAKAKASTVAAIGAAFGMEYAAVLAWIDEQANKSTAQAKIPHCMAYNTTTWLPKAGRGGWQYNAKHSDAKAMIVRRLDLGEFKKLTDDETMAAGVALFHANRLASTGRLA